MSFTKTDARLTQGFRLVIVSAFLVILGSTNPAQASPGEERSENTPIGIGKELALTGEVVMIEGNVEIVEDPSSGKKDAFLVMEHLYVAQVAGDQAIQFHINDKTHIDEDLRVGDKVEVLAADNGETLSIKRAE